MADTITTSDGTTISKLVVCKGGAHGIWTTENDRINAGLLACIRG